MGLFEAFKNGSGDAVDFVQGNFGSMKGGMYTIKRVASLFPLEYPDLLEYPPEEFKDIIENPNTDIHEVYSAANQYLATLAKETCPPPPPELAGLDDVTHKTRDISGVWDTPASLDSQGNIPGPLYRDLAKILGQFNFPIIIQTSPESHADVALLAGREIFTKDGAFRPANSVVARKPTFSISNKSGTINLSGCHAYYEIYMGKAAKSISWHSAIFMRLTTTKAGRDELAADRLLYGFNDTMKPLYNDDPVWLVTFEVCWDSVTNAVLYSKPFIDYFKQHYEPENYRIIWNNYTGSSQKIKIQAPDGVSPATTREAVTATLAAIVGKTSNPSIKFTEEGSATAIYQVFMINATINA
ncbi:hypothetical protein TWF694_010257 [Orbilia ellipsospora]|uniref:Uncharacterized protein n=1 Tax=Orbilia ellipsospora TaxID=2528407 RepID=A0AAV9XFM4_9PEZI